MYLFYCRKNEIPIKDEARPTNPISDESDEVQQDSISASRRPKQDRKRSTDCPKRIGEDGVRKCNISTHLEFTDKKQDAIDKNLNLSDINSPSLSDIPLSCRLINKTDINSTSNLPIHIASEKFKRLKFVKNTKSTRSHFTITVVIEF
ncbi:hypothetical protein PUN28_010462 [Cardiocondyla obscurior]|uniref:Uncharacterized protein n=1 Tax=Cardiocondyla obscurior TaxID=286306 RepID=A0AAW2FGH1_9HYME